MPGVDTFVKELGDLGYEADQQASFAIFDYFIEVGPRAGSSVKIAVNAAGHPHSPPSGPFVSPRLLPVRADGSPAPLGGVHPADGRDGFSDPNGTWEYWSRPFNEWDAAGRSARAYVEIHLRRLFAALPPDQEASCAN
jgi:hypothetical protein